MREWWLHESLCCLLPPPPSRSNSLTSLLPSLYPPRWFPMGLQLIQLSEHTNTICFELFLSQSFTPQLDSCAKVVHFSSKKKSPKNSWVKREKKKLCHVFSFQISQRRKPTGYIRALKMKTWRDESDNKRSGKVNKGSEGGEDQKTKAVKRREE